MTDVLQPPSHYYLDPDRRPPCVSPASVAALVDEGCEPAPARFAAEVMHLGGVFLPEHVDIRLPQVEPEFPPEAQPQERRSRRTLFLQSLFRPLGSLPAIAMVAEFPNIGVQYGRMHSRAHYSRIGISDSPYSRGTSQELVIDRLLVYDYIVRHTEFAWYGSTEQKMELFKELGVPQPCWPYRCFKSAPPDGRGTVRYYFYDQPPIGIGDWQIVFPFAAGSDLGARGIATTLVRQKTLFRELRKWGYGVIVVICYKGGDSLPSLDEFAVPAGCEDRRAFINTFFRCMCGLAIEFKDQPFLDAQGGLEVVRRRVQDVARADERRKSPWQPREMRSHECRSVPIAAKRGG